MHLQNTVEVQHTQEKMGKERSLIKTLHEYSEVTAVDANLFNSGCHHDDSSGCDGSWHQLHLLSLPSPPRAPSLDHPHSYMVRLFSEDNLGSVVDGYHVADANWMRHIMISSRDGQ